MRRAHRFLSGTLSIEALQRRVGYGGKKGIKAARKMRRIPNLRQFSTNKEDCREFYRGMDARSGKKRYAR